MSLPFLRTTTNVIAVIGLAALVVNGAELVLGTPYPLVDVNAPFTGDFSPSLSSDGRDLFFMGYNRSGGLGDSDLWFASRSAGGEAFGEPVRLPAINSTGSDSNPDVTEDGLMLFFDSARPGTSGERDIWMSNRVSIDDAWQPAQLLDAAINTRGWEGRPSISGNGLVIAFDRSHERVGRSLAVASRKSISEPFGSPVLLDNRFADGSSPGLSPDGLTVFFARFNPPEYESSNLWMARREGLDMPFGDPVLLDDKVNSLGCLVDPDVSYDGRTLLFTVSDCMSVDGFLSRGDIYAASIAAVPEPSSIQLASIVLACVGCLNRRVMRLRRGAFS